jgi:hypothetical protein
LVELHALSDMDNRFSVGWVFSTDVLAEYEDGKYGPTYLLNPAVLRGKRFTQRYKKTDRGAIAAIAAHEFIHGGHDLHYHGEDFAAKLTEIMGIVLKNWRRFARHFA